MNAALWIVQVVLAAVFIYAGVVKAVQYEQAKEKLPWMNDVSKELVTFVGVAEILGGIGVLLPALIGVAKGLVPLAALGLALIMVLAAGFHIKRREYQSITINAVLFVLAAFVSYGRWFVSPF